MSWNYTTWVYDQRTGWLYNPNGVRQTPQGYAGHGDGVNNPTMQNVKNVGPLPCGKYRRGIVRNDAQVGKFAIQLIPDPSNEMFGRADFFMHGDEIAHPGEHLASDGCCIQGLSTRQAFAESPCDELEVVATIDTEDSVWPNAT